MTRLLLLALHAGMHGLFIVAGQLLLQQYFIMVQHARPAPDTLGHQQQQRVPAIACPALSCTVYVYCLTEAAAAAAAAAPAVSRLPCETQRLCCTRNGGRAMMDSFLLLSSIAGGSAVVFDRAKCVDACGLVCSLLLFVGTQVACARITAGGDDTDRCQMRCVVCGLRVALTAQEQCPATSTVPERENHHSSQYSSPSSKWIAVVPVTIHDCSTAAPQAMTVCTLLSHLLLWLVVCAVGLSCVFKCRVAAITITSGCIPCSQQLQCWAGLPS